MPPARYLAVRQSGLRMLKPRTMLRVAVAGLAIDLLIAASTLAPNAPLLPQWPQFVLFPLIFVVHFSSVLRFTSDRGRPKWRELRRGLPPGTIVAFIVLFVVAWLVLMVSIGQIGGQPTMSGGHYYLNDHGDFIPVTRAAYRHALVLLTRSPCEPPNSVDCRVQPGSSKVGRSQPPSCIRFYPRARDRSSGAAPGRSVWLSIPFYPRLGYIMG